MSNLIIPYNPALDNYRKRCSFNTEELKTFLFTEEGLKFEKQIHDEVKKHQILLPKNGELSSVEEQKRLAIQRTFVVTSIKRKFGDIFANSSFPISWIRVIDLLDKSFAIQAGVTFSMFPATLNYSGTERHQQLYKDATDAKILGAFSLTEIGHGTNTKMMQTTATYDKNSKEFVLHTPNFEAAKCWASSLGKLGTYTIVYAQLITPDNRKRGLHSFVVPIRDPKTYLPYPGITIADMGEKIGLLGIDNGILVFNHYRIPKVNLLNKLGDVTDDGHYEVNIKDLKQQYSTSFRVLSQGRLGIIAGSNMFQVNALTAALRYSAVRRQFGPKNSEEWSILEYQTHQNRLLPYLASGYTTILFVSYLIRHKNAFTEEDYDTLIELHAILSAGKPYFSSLARDTIQECREACGGLGYLSVSGIGKLRNDNDANLTFEGDNNVLIQQTGNWLLKTWQSVVLKTIVKSPLKSIDFLNDALNILQLKFEEVSVEEFYKTQHLHRLYQWLVCYLLKRSYEKLECLQKTSKSNEFWNKHNCQIYYLRNLSVAYLESFVLNQACLLIETAPNMAIKNVLNKLVSLYAVWSLQKHVSSFYEGQYTDNPVFVKLIEDSILLLCEDIKDEVIGLIDVIAPYDDLFGSILAHSDGQVYNKLLSAVTQIPGGFANATWLNNLKSKL